MLKILGSQIRSHKFFPELKIEHTIEKRKYTQDYEIHSVFVNNGVPDKLTHAARL